jgi:hypothetical protein
MDSVDDRTTEIWPTFREHVDSISDRFLLLVSVDHQARNRR